MHTKRTEVPGRITPVCSGCVGLMSCHRYVICMLPLQLNTTDSRVYRWVCLFILPLFRRSALSVNAETTFIYTS